MSPKLQAAVAWAGVALLFWPVRIGLAIAEAGQVPSTKLLLVDVLLVGLHTISMVALARHQGHEFLNKRRHSTMLATPWLIAAVILCRDIYYFWHDTRL